MFEVFEHTADIGLRVRAPNLEQLFTEAAKGMMAIMCHGTDIETPIDHAMATCEQSNNSGNHTAAVCSTISRDIVITATGQLTVPETAPSGVAASSATKEDAFLPSVWEDLLHDWLSTILYLFSAERVVPVDYEIRFDSNGLKARVKVRRYDPDKDGGEIEIKAVTYHGMRIEKRGGEFEAQVIFDT